MRRMFKIGLMALLLLGAARTPVAERFAASIWNVGQHLHQNSAQSISPIERFVLSMATTS